MSFPYYEIQMTPKRLLNGKYKAVCRLIEHTGDKVHILLPRWELEREFGSYEAAIKLLKLNAIQYLKRELSLTEEDLKRVIITESKH